MIELLGKFPKWFALSGRNSKKYFDSKGDLKRIKVLKGQPLKHILTYKYKMKEQEAASLAAFLLPMLNPYENITIKSPKAFLTGVSQPVNC